eukprot:3881083-Pyramimonas_sp.AAC.1
MAKRRQIEVDDMNLDSDSEDSRADDDSGNAVTLADIMKQLKKSNRHTKRQMGKVTNNIKEIKEEQVHIKTAADKAL